MIEDRFQTFKDSPIAPSRSCQPISPDDEAELSVATKALYVGSGGDVTLVAIDDGAAVEFRNLVAGTTLDVRVRKVLASGTTASSLVGLY